MLLLHRAVGVAALALLTRPLSAFPPEGSDLLMLPSRAMGKMILSICEPEITSALCSSAFVVVVK